MTPSNLTRGARTATAAAALVLLAACTTAAGGGAPASSAPAASAPASSAPAASTPASGADLTVADSALGQIVVDHAGLTAYYFDKDKAGSGASTCSGDCLVAWPAIAPAAATPSVDGVTAKVGTITRDDGTAQVTLEGRPVYLFAKDAAPGDVKGQGVGGVWYVIAPDGTEIKQPSR